MEKCHFFIKKKLKNLRGAWGSTELVAVWDLCPSESKSLTVFREEDDE